MPTKVIIFSMSHVKASAMADTAFDIQSKMGDAKAPMAVLSFLVLFSILDIAWS